MASSKVPDKDVKAVANAFFDMGRDPKGKEILHDVSKTIGLAQDAYFIPASNADYAAYRRFYQSAPIALH
jgi:phosphonate transport system substrate-binding protein